MNQKILSAQETWSKISQLKSVYGCKIIYHYHIPKTGGTSLFANLQQNSNWLCINSGGDVASKIKQAEDMMAKNAGTTLNIFARSHNTMKFMKKGNYWGKFDLAFFTYRHPMHIQISNLNMIISRILKYASNSVDSYSEVGRWTQLWIDKLNISPGDLHKEKHILAGLVKDRLILSKDYEKEYAGILGRYFSDQDDLSELGKELHIITMSDLNELTSKLLLSNVKHNNYNVAEEYFITEDDLTPDIKKSFLRQDLEILDRLDYLIDREDCKAKLFDALNKLGII